MFIDVNNKQAACRKLAKKQFNPNRTIDFKDIPPNFNLVEKQAALYSGYLRYAIFAQSFIKLLGMPYHKTYVFKKLT
ncbi:MAG: hypothetical protein ABIA93_07205 [Candidatus Woesearchaeota archaeon]